jgi:hypothetical protein
LVEVDATVVKALTGDGAGTTGVDTGVDIEGVGVGVEAAEKERKERGINDTSR